jgi:anti-sigma factor RsiW
MRPHCPVTEDELSSLVDDELSGRAQRRVASHAVNCPHCAQMLGSLLAGKRFLSARGQPVDVPAGSWQRLIAEIDRADGLARTATMDPLRPRRSYLPALAAAGLVLLLGVWGWQSRHAPPPASPGLFARAHEAAWGQFAPIGATRNPGAWADVSEVTTPRSVGTQWVPVARALMPLRGQIIEQSLYRVDRTPVSEFVLPSETFSPRGYSEVRVNGAPFLCRTEGGGSYSLVAWEAGRITNVLVGRTHIQDLLLLAATRRAQVPLTRSL